jgi:hypothetical protein
MLLGLSESMENNAFSLAVMAKSTSHQPRSFVSFPLRLSPNLDLVHNLPIPRVGLGDAES